MEPEQYVVVSAALRQARADVADGIITEEQFKRLRGTLLNPNTKKRQPAVTPIHPIHHLRHRYGLGSVVRVEFIVDEFAGRGQEALGQLGFLSPQKVRRWDHNHNL